MTTDTLVETKPKMKITSTFNEKAFQEKPAIEPTAFARMNHSDGKSYIVCQEDGYGYYIRTEPERTLISENREGLSADLQAQISNKKYVLELPFRFGDPDFDRKAELFTAADECDGMPVESLPSHGIVSRASSNQTAQASSTKAAFGSAASGMTAAPQSSKYIK